jgi:hypothetical protein
MEYSNLNNHLSDKLNSQHSNAMKTEAACFCETLAKIYQTEQCHIPEDSNLSHLPKPQILHSFILTTDE